MPNQKTTMNEATSSRVSYVKTVLEKSEPALELIINMMNNDNTTLELRVKCAEIYLNHMKLLMDLGKI